METNVKMSGAGSTSQTDSAAGEFPRIMLQGIQPKPTITPEKIGRVMADVQSQIDGLQLYLIELGLAKTRVTLLGEKGWAHGDRDGGPVTVKLLEDTCAELA